MNTLFTAPTLEELNMTATKAVLLDGNFSQIDEENISKENIAIHCKVPEVDGKALRDLYKDLYNIIVYNEYMINKVIVNGPATVIFWKDGSKTVVKHDGDGEPDREKGILYAIVKKLAPSNYVYGKLLSKIDECKED